MKLKKNDPRLSDLPAPISLAPEQLAEVAGGLTIIIVGGWAPTAPIHIAGGIRIPVMTMI